jgi:hypothetical protein
MGEERHCWAFEAGSIQAFILETGRLADAVGASLLVDRLTGDLGEEADAGDLLSVVLKAAGAGSGDVRFSRRGGGAFIAFFDDAALLRRVRCLWHAALHVNAPGLRWADGVASHPTSFKDAAAGALAACQVASRTEAVRLPEAVPPALRVARTGQPAVARQRLGAKGMEPVDAATLARRRHATAAHRLRALTNRFSAQPGLVWPRDMEAYDPGDDVADLEAASPGAGRFPFAGGDREVAFLHADGNGLGVLLRELAKASEKDYLESYAHFSRAVSLATREAAAEATEQVLLAQTRSNGDGTRTVPARPLVLGGDDLSIIVRADLALPFAEAFLKAFEARTKARLSGVRWPGGRLSGLTAACGVAFVNASFPFQAAADLAERLCARAKRAIKAEAKVHTRATPLSGIAVHRVTTALADEDLPLVSWNGLDWPLGQEAYVLAPERPSPGLPRWEDLLALAGRLGRDASPRGPARRLLIDLKRDMVAARETYRRWRELRQATDAQGLQSTDALLKRLGVTDATLPLGRLGTPWPDALLVAELTELAGGAATGGGGAPGRSTR